MSLNLGAGLGTYGYPFRHFFCLGCSVDYNFTENFSVEFVGGINLIVENQANFSKSLGRLVDETTYTKNIKINLGCSYSFYEGKYYDFKIKIGSGIAIFGPTSIGLSFYSDSEEQAITISSYEGHKVKINMNDKENIRKYFQYLVGWNIQPAFAISYHLNGYLTITPELYYNYTGTKG